MFNVEDEMLEQLALALEVYRDIERYEKENGLLPDFCSHSFTMWRRWRKDKKLEK